MSWRRSRSRPRRGIVLVVAHGEAVVTQPLDERGIVGHGANVDGAVGDLQAGIGLAQRQYGFNKHGRLSETWKQRA